LNLGRLKRQGAGRKLHNQELHNLYSSPDDQIKEDEMARACRAHGGDKKSYTVLLESLKGREN
jgi:hypothetical protein